MADQPSPLLGTGVPSEACPGRFHTEAAGAAFTSGASLSKSNLVWEPLITPLRASQEVRLPRDCH